MEVDSLHSGRTVAESEHVEADEAVKKSSLGGLELLNL